MTDRSSHLDDERFSALMDGVGPADDEEHVGACPECSATLATWRRTAGLIAGVAQPDEADKVRAIRAALTGGAGSAVVTPIASRPSLPRRRWSAVVAVAAAAALVALVAVSLSHHRSHPSSQSESAPAASTTPTTSAGSAGTALTPSSGAASSATTLFEPRSVPDLGSFADVGSVLTTLRARLELVPSVSPSTVSPESSTTGPLLTMPCLASAAATASAPAGAAEFAARLDLRGVAALVFVFDGGEGRVAVIVKAVGCGPLVRQAF